MSQVGHSLISAKSEGNRRTFVIGRSFEWIALAMDVLATLAVSVLAAGLYHWLIDDSLERLRDHAGVGLAVALVYAAVRMSRGGYDVKAACRGDIGFLKIVSAWNFAMCGILVLSFLTKVSGTYYSRGAIVLFYLGGIGALLAVRHLVIRVVERGIGEGWLSTSRALLIGTPDRVQDFMNRFGLRGGGLQIVSTVTLPEVVGASDGADRGSLLQRAVDEVRKRKIEDVFLAVPWSDHVMIEQAGDAFLNVPARLHLGTERILDRFANVAISRTGPVAGLELARPALGPRQQVVKRGMDVALALTALVLLAPLFVVLGVLVKLDSPGKVFFRQKRYGFNQEEFEIIKFRSMTTSDEGEHVKQATRNDIRITRTGRWLRSTNLDELPQLVNVLMGQMSFVGPRPHAVIHNREYERKISTYARRHNVKPGITGWAQVNGLRGETDTDAKMRARVKCDLYYIDNWSAWFDIYIILRTVFSASAYRNAR